ncbi:MAG: nucleoside hydrolase, partial [SAR86 cluster bacterium]|nr:nucleoside hydrolase [SAR86 cluster bacterium]
MNEDSRKKIIIDTDPAMGTKGGDPEDCFAIMLAMNSPELEILGITTVQGNVPVERGFSNASYLVKELNQSIPVHTGKPGTFDQERNKKREWLGQREQMEQITPIRSIQEDDKGAPLFIVETCKENSKDIELVTIGPLTNIAQALEIDSKLSKHVNKITMMGGAATVQG